MGNYASLKWWKGQQDCGKSENQIFDYFREKYKGAKYSHGVAVSANGVDSNGLIWDTSRKVSVPFSAFNLAWSIVNVFQVYSFSITVYCAMSLQT